MSTLYEINGDLLALQEAIDSEEYDEDMLLDTLEAVSGERDEKFAGYGKVIANMNATVTALKAEEARLTARRRTIEKGIDRMKKALYESMILSHDRVVDTGIFKFTIAKNGGKLPIELDVDPEQLPDGFVKVTKTADKDAIRQYLESFGKSEYAHYAERGESLRIK